MSIILKLPKYVLREFLQDWLEFESAVRLDSAVLTIAEREQFLWCGEDVSHEIRIPKGKSFNCYIWLSKRRRFIRSLLVVWENWFVKTNLNMDYSIFSKVEKVIVNSENGKDLFLPLYCSRSLATVCMMHHREDCLNQWVTDSLPSSVTSLELHHVLSCLSLSSIRLLLRDAKGLNTLKICESSNYEMRNKTLFALNNVGLHLRVFHLSGWSENSVQCYVNSIEENCPLLEDLSLDIRTDVVRLSTLTSLLRLRRLRVTRCLFLSLDKNSGVFSSVEDLTVSFSHLSDGCLLYFPHLVGLSLVTADLPQKEGCRYIVSTSSDVSAQCIITTLLNCCPLITRVDLKGLAMPEWEQRKLREFNKSRSRSVDLFVNIGRCKQPSSLHHVVSSAAAASKRLKEKLEEGEKDEGNTVIVNGLVYRLRPVGEDS